MPNSSGLVARKDLRCDEDAVVVARVRKVFLAPLHSLGTPIMIIQIILKQAGAIPLGVTNTSELCMWMESNNKIYGRTNNPYNIHHTVGGSSGGEGTLLSLLTLSLSRSLTHIFLQACILAACGAPFGIGSDIGGSIRMPAFFCGIFGHKPSVCLSSLCCDFFICFPKDN